MCDCPWSYTSEHCTSLHIAKTHKYAPKLLDKQQCGELQKKIVDKYCKYNYIRVRYVRTQYCLIIYSMEFWGFSFVYWRSIAR